MRRPRFNLARLLIWMHVFSLYLVTVSILPSSTEALCVGAVALVLLLVLDAFRGGYTNALGPALCIARYSFGLVVAIAVAFLALLAFPPGGGGQSTAGSVGEWGHDAVDEIGWAIGVVFSYMLVIGLLSLVSFTTAFLQWSRHDEAKCLAILNIPGLCLLAGCLIIMAIEFLGDL